jgi:hypothetical protein
MAAVFTEITKAFSKKGKAAVEKQVVQYWTVHYLFKYVIIQFAWLILHYECLIRRFATAWVISQKLTRGSHKPF